MSDQSKIEKIESLIKLNNLSFEQESDLIDLALSVNDQEDRDLMLEKIAIVLARSGKYDKSRELLDKVDGAYERSEGFIEIAAILAMSSQARDAFIALKEAEEPANQAPAAWQRAELLNRIARDAFSLGEREESIRILKQAISIAQHGEESESVQDSLDSSSVLWDISQTLAQIGEREKAFEVANSIKSQGKRENAIKSLEQ